MKLELSILAGADSKHWLAELTKQLDRLESMLPFLTGVATGTASNIKQAVGIGSDGSGGSLGGDDDDDDDEEEEVDVISTSKLKKGKAPVDEDEDEEDDDVVVVGKVDEEDEDEEDDFIAKPAKKSSFDTDDEDEEEAEEVPAAKKAKGKAKSAEKKITSDDCNDAAKALATSIGGKAGRTKVLGLMKKHFKVESVSDLKPGDYGRFIEVMAVQQ